MRTPFGGIPPLAHLDSLTLQPVAQTRRASWADRDDAVPVSVEDGATISNGEVLLVASPAKGSDLLMWQATPAG